MIFIVQWGEIIEYLFKVVPIAVTAYMGWHKWVDYLIQKEKERIAERIKLAEIARDEKGIEADRQIELANAEVEKAKHNSLTAAQVADIAKNYVDITDQLEEMKRSDVEKNSRIFNMIEKIEHTVKENAKLFTEFLIGKAKNT